MVFQTSGQVMVKSRLSFESTSLSCHSREYLHWQNKACHILVFRRAK